MNHIICCQASQHPGPKTSATTSSRRHCQSQQMGAEPALASSMRYDGDPILTPQHQAHCAASVYPDRGAHQMGADPAMAPSIKCGYFMRNQVASMPAQQGG